MGGKLLHNPRWTIALSPIARIVAWMIARSPYARCIASLLRRAIRISRWRPLVVFAGHLGDAWSRGATWGSLAGASIYLDLHDKYHHQIYFHGVYEPLTTQLLDALVEPGDVVVDVGANVGYYSLRAAAQGATVIAFEPYPYVADLLEASLRRNPSLSVTLHRVACDAQHGQAALSISSDARNAGLSSIASTHPGGQQVTVPTVRLDDIVSHADVIKVDVEGHEAAVLAAATRLISRRPKAIICETADTMGRDRPLLELLRTHGYVPKRIASGGRLIDFTYRPMRDAGDLENLCFVPADAPG